MFEPATRAQREYLEILLNDRGFTTRVSRYGFISVEMGRTVNYLDEISKAEASKLIGMLKEDDE